MQIFLLALAVLALVLATEVLAAPTLARLSFWAPQERMAEFEADYQAKVVPILRKHELVEYSEGYRSCLEILMASVSPTIIDAGQKGDVS